MESWEELRTHLSDPMVKELGGEDLVESKISMSLSVDDERRRRRRRIAWGELLPEDLLDMICKRLNSFQDFVAFGGVCSQWRSCAVHLNNFGQPLKPLPWLMLAEDDSARRKFYSLTQEGNNRIYELTLPELKGKKSIGTKGWIVTSSEERDTSLFHPLTRAEIPLPHQTTFKYFGKNGMMRPLSYVQRAVLSCSAPNHSDKDCVLMCIIGSTGHLVFWRPGDKASWNVIESRHCPFQNIEFFKGRFYAVDNVGVVWKCDVIRQSSPPSTILARVIAGVPFVYVNYKRLYLVKSGDSLLLVTRNKMISCPEKKYGTSNFIVLEIIEEEEGRGCYKEVKSLGTRSIFIGHSASFTVDTRMYPGIIPNCVYFTDDNRESYSSRFCPEGGGSDMGIYNLADGSLQPLFNGESLSRVCPPVWTFLTAK